MPHPLLNPVSVSVGGTIVAVGGMSVGEAVGGSAVSVGRGASVGGVPQATNSINNTKVSKLFSRMISPL